MALLLRKGEKYYKKFKRGGRQKKMMLKLTVRIAEEKREAITLCTMYTMNLVTFVLAAQSKKAMATNKHGLIVKLVQKIRNKKKWKLKKLMKRQCALWPRKKENIAKRKKSRKMTRMR